MERAANSAALLTDLTYTARPRMSKLTPSLTRKRTLFRPPTCLQVITRGIAPTSSLTRRFTASRASSKSGRHRCREFAGASTALGVMGRMTTASTPRISLICRRMSTMSSASCIGCTEDGDKSFVPIETTTTDAPNRWISGNKCFNGGTVRPFCPATFTLVKVSSTPMRNSAITLDVKLRLTNEWPIMKRDIVDMTIDEQTTSFKPFMSPPQRPENGRLTNHSVRHQTLMHHSLDCSSEGSAYDNQSCNQHDAMRCGHFHGNELNRQCHEHAAYVNNEAMLSRRWSKC